MPLKKITTVIIEDSEVDLWLLTFMLKKFGDIELVDSARSGTEGIKSIEKNKPDLVFLDLDLPEISGIEIARMVSRNNLNSDIIFVTSFEQYAGEVKEFEPVDYLIKPLSMDILTEVLIRYREKNKKVC